MSAFIVDNSTINRIVDFCEGLQHVEGPLSYLESPRFLNCLEACEKFGRDLYQMNVDAVAARYGTADDMVPEGGYVYAPAGESTTGQVLKSLDCYLYQCSEGNVPETDLFKAMADLRNRLSRVIATDTPEYERATWG